MKKLFHFLPLVLALLLLTACGPKEVQMLYDEAPSRFEYGVFVNMDINAGNAVTDYQVAFNNFADRTGYAFYSERGLTPVSQEMAKLTEEDLEALAEENKAVAIESNVGFQPLPKNLTSLDGEPFKSSEKDKFYHIYVAYADTEGVSVEKADRFMTPEEGPAALKKYSNSSVGAVVPAGGSTSVFEASDNYSPDYLNALKQGAVEAGVEVPRVAMIMTTMGTEQELDDAMNLPDEDYPSYGDAFRAAGMEPVYIPLAMDNYTHVQNSPYFADLIRSCHIVFFTGGNQTRYGLALANADGTPSLVAQAIVDVITKGGTLGGSSAGAAAMSGTVLTSGASGSYQPFYWNEAETLDVTTLDPETLEEFTTANEGNNLLYKSIGFVEPVLGQDILLDTHVDARGRVGRVIAGLRDANPTGMAIAMEEGTGIRMDGESKVGTVFGISGVYIVDAAQAQWSKAGTVGEFGVENLTVHYLTAGDQFDFEKKIVVPGEDKKPIENPTGEVHVSQDVFAPDETGITLLSFAHSAETSVTAEVANVSVPPYLMGNCFSVVFEKTENTQCLTNGKAMENPYLEDFLQTTVSGLKVNIVSGPSKFNPDDAAGFDALSVVTEDNGYAVNIEFSGPISVGFEESNKYFLDCLLDENDPTAYVEVTDASGAVKEQDRSYTFCILDDNKLRVVLVEDVFFEEGDVIVVKPTLTSLYGEATAGATFRLTDGKWLMDGQAPAQPEETQPEQTQPEVQEGEFKALSVVTEDNGYAVDVKFSGAISVGFEVDGSQYFMDCLADGVNPYDYAEVLDAGGAAKQQDTTYTFKILDGDTLRIVLVEDAYFAEGDQLVIKNTVTNTEGASPSQEVTFVLADGKWTIQP